jgi:hypothetical protein
MLKPLALVCMALSASAAFADTPPDPQASPAPAPTEPSPEPTPTPEPAGLDPNYSRLLFSPTGRPLEKGDGYFSDHELVFPGVAYGITGNVSISAGFSFFPGQPIHDQLFYISPRVGWNLGDKVAVSVGGLYAVIPDDGRDDSLGAGFAVATFGGRKGSLSVGVGLVDDYLPDGFQATPILMVGGTVTVARHVALVAETWLGLDEGFDPAEQPFGLGVRFFSGRLSADVGLVFVPEYVADGAFLPWASISWHFGPSTAARQQRKR